MPRTKVGVIGVGFIGEEHLKALHDHGRFEVVGLTDQSADLAASRATQYGVTAYPTHQQLLSEARPDYVAICTPHFSHVSIAIDAMRQGVHVLAEKPLTVAATAADECLQVMNETGMTLGVGFVMRLHPAHQRLQQMVEDGFLGELVRVTLVRTDWFRSMAYYRSNPWRGTWQGEGGGIVVNQAPHDLDLLLWTAGYPSEVLVEMNTSGHDIEVEDDVCALFKWPQGATGTLHVSTNEAPGRNYFELAGTRGTLRLENGAVTATRLSVDSRHFSETTAERMIPPPVSDIVTYEPREEHQPFRLLHENFADAIHHGTPLVCSAQEALQEVELANAMLLSGVSRQWVSLPPDRAAFDAALADLWVAGSLRTYHQQRDEANLI